MPSRSHPDLVPRLVARSCSGTRASGRPLSGPLSRSSSRHSDSPPGEAFEGGSMGAGGTKIHESFAVAPSTTSGVPDARNPDRRRSLPRARTVIGRHVPRIAPRGGASRGRHRHSRPRDGGARPPYGCPPLGRSRPRGLALDPGREQQQHQAREVLHATVTEEAEGKLSSGNRQKRNWPWRPISALSRILRTSLLCRPYQLCATSS